MVAEIVRELIRSTNQPVRVGKIVYLPNSLKPSGVKVHNRPDLFYPAAHPETIRRTMNQ